MGIRAILSFVGPFRASASLAQLIAACLAALSAWTLFSVVVGVGLERLSWARGRRVFALPLRAHQRRHEWIGTGLFVMMFAPALAAAISLHLLRFTGGWVAEVTGFAVPFFGFQLFYYWLHRAMHRPWLFFVHRWHHESHVTTPVTGFSMHPAETLGSIVGTLGPAALLARFDLLGLGGFVAFLAFLWFGNIVGHANAEVMPWPVTWASSLTSNAVVFHALHHARYTGHYGFATSVLDRVFGTEWPDWLPLYERIIRGRPLERLQERGDPSPATVATSPPRAADPPLRP